MNAGTRFQYLWTDGETIKQPMQVSAIEYYELLMKWVKAKMEDEKYFPVDIDAQFPKDFEKLIRVVFKKFFRIYAHLYYSHFDEIQQLKLLKHLNTSFKHFLFFVMEFRLINKKELAPMIDVIYTLVPEFKNEKETTKKKKKEARNNNKK